MSKERPALDMLGALISPGTRFAYALTIGRSASMSIYECVEVTWSEDGRTNEPFAKVKARQLLVSYGRLNSKLVTLAMCDRRAVVLDHQTVLAMVIALEKQKDQQRGN